MHLLENARDQIQEQHTQLARAEQHIEELEEDITGYYLSAC